MDVIVKCGRVALKHNLFLQFILIYSHLINFML